MTAVRIAKKLSMKALVGGRPIPNIDGSVKWLANIAGVASGYKTGESNFGPWTALVGNFMAEAANAETGEVIRFRTGTLFLPDVALGLVVPQIDSVGKGAQIKFAFRVGILRDDSAATGYTYTAESLIEPEENDPLEALSSQAFSADSGALLLTSQGISKPEAMKKVADKKATEKLPEAA